MEQLKLDLDTWFGKTCREHSAQTGGEDFRAVLEETVRIVDKDAVIPRPACGKWRNSGCIVGDGFSVAWRVLDAQFWGVPQRRRRIALVADFGGGSALEILFGRKGVQRGIEESGGERKKLPPLLKEVLEKQSGLTIWREVRREAWEQKENGAKRFERAGTERRCVIL